MGGVWGIVRFRDEVKGLESKLRWIAQGPVPQGSVAYEEQLDTDFPHEPSSKRELYRGLCRGPL